MGAPERIILMGGSSGGVRAVTEALEPLERDLPAAILVVLHLPDGTSHSLRTTFANACSLAADFAADGEALEAGRIYLCPPNHHLLLSSSGIHLTRGPRINMTRPAIDPAFRSAAVTWGSRAVGVILSGMLDDGLAGLEAVSRCGGIAIVQDPGNALYPELPENVLNYNEKIDHILPAHRIGPLLNELARRPAPEESEIPPEIRRENELDMEFHEEYQTLDSVGHEVPLVCPECLGPLWEITKSDPPRFRCHVGHCFSLRTLRKSQDEHLEKVLLTAYRSLEEKARTQERMAACYDTSGQSKLAEICRRRAWQTLTQANRLRTMLVG